MLLQSQGCQRASPAGHTQGLGTGVVLKSPNESCPFSVGRSFAQHCHRRRNFLDGSSRLTFLQQAVTFHPLRWAASSSLLCSENKAPWRKGERLTAPSSCFGKAVFQHSCFPLWVSWCTGFGVRFNGQKGACVPLDWWCVLSVVPPRAALCQEDVEVEEDDGELTLKCF